MFQLLMKHMKPLDLIALVVGFLLLGFSYLEPSLLSAQWHANVLSIGISLVSTWLYQALARLEGHTLAGLGELFATGKIPPKKISAPAKYFFVILLTFIISKIGLSYGSRPKPYPENGIVAKFTATQNGIIDSAAGDISSASDSTYDGSSRCWTETRADPVPGQAPVAYLRFQFQLNPHSSMADSYANVYTTFSFPPPTVYDISAYHFVMIRLRMPADVPKADLRLYVEIATDNPPKTPGLYDWCEAQIDVNAVSDNWRSVIVPFSDIISPKWSIQSPPRKFDTTRAFQFILSLRTSYLQQIHGCIDIEDVEFIK